MRPRGGVTPAPPALAPPAGGRRAQGCWPDPAGDAHPVPTLPRPRLRWRRAYTGSRTPIRRPVSAAPSRSGHTAPAWTQEEAAVSSAPARRRGPGGQAGVFPSVAPVAWRPAPAQPSRACLGPSWHQSPVQSSGLPPPTWDHPHQNRRQKGERCGSWGARTRGGWPVSLGEETPQRRGQRSPGRQCRSPASGQRARSPGSEVSRCPRPEEGS